MTGPASIGHEEFAATLAEIGGTLPAGHVAAWCEVLARSGPFDGVEAALVDTASGYAVAIQARRLVTAWRRHAPDLPGAAVALALRSAALVHAEAVEHRADLVVSGPTSESAPVRLTGSVVVELIRAARESLLVVSFAAYGVAEVVAELRAAASRGVRIDLVLESSTLDGGTLRGASAARAFVELRDHATFWHWPTGRRGASGGPTAALHAKVITTDARAALISSANLTDRALSSNLEIGVVLRDPDLVGRLVRHVTALMAPEAGVLERLSGGRRAPR